MKNLTRTICLTLFDHWAQLANRGWSWVLAPRTGLEPATYGLEGRETNWSK